MKAQICRPLQVLPSGYTTMCGQRLSRPIAFCCWPQNVSNGSGSALHGRLPQAHPYSGRAQSYLQLWSRCPCPRGPRRWFAATSSAAQCTKRHADGVSHAERAHIAAQGRRERDTHVAHDGKAHVLSSRHANRQAAPQEEPDVRKALRARKRHGASALELTAFR